VTALIPVVGLLFAVLVPLYFVSFIKLYGIIQAEHPEWLDRPGSLDGLYTHLPRVGKPNVSTAVIQTVFGPRASQLQSADAAWHAGVVRVLLPAELLLFATLLALIWAKGG
jgi:hypothetical protein